MSRVRRLTGTVNVGEAPLVVDVSPDGSLALVTCADGASTRSRHRTAASARLRAELRHPHGVSLTPDGKRAYVTDTERDAVLVLESSSLRSIGRIPVGATPWNTAFKRRRFRRLRDQRQRQHRLGIDTASQRVRKTIALGSSNGQINQIPTAIARSPSGSIWAACNTSGSLVVIDPSTNTVTKSIEIGLADEPTGIAFA